MARKLYWICIVAALAAAVLLGVQRVALEQANRSVEMVVDFRSAERLGQAAGHSTQAVMTALREAGVQGAAVAERPLADYLIQGRPLPEALTAAWWQEPLEMPVLLTERGEFWVEDRQLVESVGLRVVPRPATKRFLESETEVADALAGLASPLVIFSSAEIPGYPEGLAETRRALRDADAVVGLVEFFNQRGIAHVARPHESVRVYAVSAREMAVLSDARILARYLRAVRERNMRVLYLHPFFTGDAPLERTVELVESTRSLLESSGYAWGSAEPFPPWTVRPAALAVIWLGIWAAFGLCLQAVWRGPSRWIHGGLLVLWLLSLAAGAVLPLWTRQGMALFAAVVFPCLALLTAGRPGPAFVRFGLACLVSAIGGLLVAGTLSGTEFLVKLAEFRGVKLMHVLPPAAMVVFGLYADFLPAVDVGQLKRRTQQLAASSIPVVLLGAAVVVVGLLFVYLRRTGNFGIPVSHWEIAVREGLEQLLVARPRTKEFLIGHPALILALSRTRSWHWLWVPGIIGQLSIVNTFSHLHTPLLITCLRTVNGIVLGAAAGLLLILLCRWLGRWLPFDRCVRLLRVPESWR